jgi:hypothetical protein
MTSSKVLQYTAVLVELMENKEWQKFSNFSFSSPSFFQALNKAMVDCPELNGMTLLHAAVRVNPPLDVVAQMITFCPDLLAARDCLNRTPLHVAAGSKATPQLIKLLADAYPGACDVQDEDGRTPLHFACDSSCELFQDDHMKTCTPPSNMSIRALLSVSMRAATLEDVDEMNAIEYAIISNASLQTIKLLQKASIRHFTGKTLHRQMHEV